ncbi:Hypothetical predicted protein [Marmota monax]|uniref:Uncharacterized protein n=1 Tax=Marmota monax TaxID=9995 RepID=A0A5E4C4S8_MARMO|nr:hypothetical protein GHT09_003116 [Marmota monax]VTJ75872.1 Hypothetical predicted protein [Marmota monax]
MHACVCMHVFPGTHHTLCMSACFCKKEKKKRKKNLNNKCSICFKVPVRGFLEMTSGRQWVSTWYMALKHNVHLIQSRPRRGTVRLGSASSPALCPYMATALQEEAL